MEDVAAGQPKFLLEFDRRVRLEAGCAVGVHGQAIGDRLGEAVVERGESESHRLVLACVVVIGKQPRGHVQTEHGQRVPARSD